MSVKKLPNNVQRLLNASSRVNNFKQVIEELVYNSLDAGSTSIAIRVYMQNSWIQVVDNGDGIKKLDFNLLGERNATSKLFDVNSLKALPCKYGYQGQALANIIEVSKSVKISSRYRTSDETWIKIFFEGKQKECREIPKRPSKGTTVEISGFLFNLHIQRQCVYSMDELQDIKLFLRQLSLVFYNVSMSLRDDSESEIVLKIHKHRDIYQTLTSLFEINLTDLKELQVEKNEYKVKAYIGSKDTEDKKYHWVYLNNKLVYNSNINKMINGKFSKNKCTVGVQGYKNKRKVYYQERDMEESIPIYFLFISCPYYDYDIINSAKETTIEFKDWQQINMLIDKLVQFYNGDRITTQKKIDKNPSQIAKTADTRDEVKKIIKKIMGSYTKKSKIPEIQNGITGRQTKRKKKKKQSQITHTKVLRSTIPCETLDYYKPSQNEVIRNNKDALKTGSKKQKKLTTIKPNLKLKVTHKSSKPINKTTLCKCNKNNDDLIQIFQNNTDTVQRRCHEILKDIHFLPSIKNKLETIENSFYQDINEICVKNGGKNLLTTSNKQKNSKFTNITNLNDKKHRGTQYDLKSYDLLQTILKTQQAYQNQDILRENTYISIQKSNVYQTQYTSSDNIKSKLTFESHKYNIKEYLHHKEERKKFKFISKQSNDNFALHTRRDKKNCFKSGKIIKNRCAIRNNVIKRTKYLDKYKQDSLNTQFSIDMSGSDFVEISKKIRNQIFNDMTLISNERHKIQSKTGFNEQFTNIGVDYNLQSTYTILLDSFQNSNQKFNLQENQVIGMKESVTKDTNNCMDYDDKTYSKEDEKLRKTVRNNSPKDKLNVIFTSEPQNPFYDKSIEPLDICETVMSDELQVEFNKRFNDSKNNLTLVKGYPDKSDKDIFIDNNIYPFTEKHDSNIKTLAEEKSHFEMKKHEMSFNNFEKETDINYVSNFQLKSRHRFMPKGMSPIFKNCFTKNICSYNLDTEYYEDVIYNNFVEDVVANTEKFEPQIENLKEVTTKHLQKVTNKIIKNTSVLMFGTESLAAAKVLGQVDCKFIAAIIFGKSKTIHESSVFLVLFDQHAVHERIRLENNLSHYIVGSNWKNVTIDPISLKISKDEILYLHNHKDKFTQFGLEWTLVDNCEILVNAIPEAVMGKNPRPVESIKKSVNNLISEQIHAIKYLKGNVSLYPQSIMRLVFSEACRYSIKFGDALSKIDCENLIAALANCKTPFQCAHGRPVMAVMMEMQDYTDNNKYKVILPRLPLTILMDCGFIVDKIS